MLVPTARNDPSSHCTSRNKNKPQTPAQQSEEMAAFTIPFLDETKMQQHIHSKARLIMLVPTARNDPSSHCTSRNKNKPQTPAQQREEMAAFAIPFLDETKLQQHIHSKAR
jgi:hypothetical protein